MPRKPDLVVIKAVDAEKCNRAFCPRCNLTFDAFQLDTGIWIGVCICCTTIWHMRDETEEERTCLTSTP